MRALPILLLVSLAAGCSDGVTPSSAFAPPAASGPVVVPSLPTPGVLVIAARGQLLRADLEGQNLQTLTSGFLDSDPFFHPRGENVLFTRQVGPKRDLFVMAPDGSGAVNLTPGLPGDSSSPVYAPDASFIVFANGADLYRLSPDGTGLASLTQGPELDGHPTVSPDSRHVAFQRATGDGRSQLCLLSLESGAVTDLTEGAFLDLEPAFGPGNSLFFSRDGALMVMDDTSNPGDVDPVVASHAMASSPVHSDGAVFFASDDDVAVTDADGRSVRQLVSDVGVEGLAVSPASGPVAAPNQVTVEIVNDSQIPDGRVYVLLDTPKTENQSVVGPPTLLTGSGGAGANGHGVPLTSLRRSAQKARSRYSGRLLPVYYFQVSNLDSGHISLSYDKPVKIVNGSNPTAHEPYRYEKVELTYLSSQKSGGGNLTSIDFFGIPVQVDVRHAGEAAIDGLQTKTFFVSTRTLLRIFDSLGPGMERAFKDVAGQDFPVNGNLRKFARILSPNTLAAAAGSGGSPAPYPSLLAYLESLVGKAFLFEGKQFGGYRYTGRMRRDGQGGYVMTLTGTTNVAPPSPIPPNAEVTIRFPKELADFYLYACVANKDSYAIAGFPFTTQADVLLAASSAYVALVGDVQAALNFGYLGGRYGVDIDRLYGSVVLPYPYPFEGARKANDGYYNAYAGVFYYLSDSYGHPYSDRLSAASPLYSLVAGDTAIITILDDNRLDAPLATVLSRTASSVQLSWQKVPGANHYTVDVEPPEGKVAVQGTGCTITGLKPGTPYLVGVTAGDGTRLSATLPVQAVTTGSRAPLAGGAINFQANANLPVTGYSIEINGSPVGPTQNATIAGNLGENVFGLRILNANQAVVYEGNYSVTTVAAGPGTFELGPFTLEYNLTPLTQAGPQPYSNNPARLVIGTPFNPKPYFRYFKSRFP